jgi:hypothetical protein
VRERRCEMTRQQYLDLIKIERSRTSFVSSEQAYAQYRRMNGLNPADPPSAACSNGHSRKDSSSKMSNHPTND